MNDHTPCANALWRAWVQIEQLIAQNSNLQHRLEEAETRLKESGAAPTNVEGDSHVPG